jgi:hypothetical protein
MVEIQCRVIDEAKQLGGGPLLGIGEKLLSDHVSRILGKPGRKIDDFAKDHARDFI